MRQPQRELAALPALPAAKSKKPRGQIRRIGEHTFFDFFAVCGTLLFAQQPALKLPTFIVKAGAFPSDTLATTKYLDSKDIKGKLADIFFQTVDFIIAVLEVVSSVL